MVSEHCDGKNDLSPGILSEHNLVEGGTEPLCFQNSQNKLGVNPQGIAVFTYSQRFKFSCSRDSSQCFTQILESSNECPLTQARKQPDSEFLSVCAVSLYREANLSLERGYLEATVNLSK